jgi:hypothetical protein
MSPDGIFGTLHGSWSFVRSVSGQAEMTGRASVSALDLHTALYEERAEIHLVDGNRLHGERRYVYRASPTGFEVLFHDSGDLFHALHFVEQSDGSFSASARHQCAADLYLSTYRVGEDGFFNVRHIVSGPRKEYTIQTDYSRVPKPELATV